MDWMTLVSTIAAAVAAVGALASIVYSQLTLADARRDRELGRLQRIAGLLVKIRDAALNDAHEWEQDRELLRQELIVGGFKNRWSDCVSLLNQPNPPGGSEEDRRSQKLAADSAANFANLALAQVGLAIETLVGETRT
jgi:hypothetical protein